MIKQTLFLILIVYCFAHSKLNFPTPWNPQPSKSNPCGGAGAPATPAANFKKGATVNLVWQVIAGDGVGDVTVQIDTTGGTNFATPVVVTAVGPTPTTVGTFNFAITVPSVTCTGTGGFCTLRIFSTSNWFSCSSILITDTGGNVPLPSTCVVPTTNSFCQMVRSKQVLLPGGQTKPDPYDVTLQQTFNSTLYNPLVFSTPNAPGCYDAFKYFFCGMNFPLCSKQPAGCQSYCLQAMSKCGVTETHKGLYNCTQYTNTDFDATGTCPPKDASFGVKIVPSFILLISLVIFLL